MSETGHNISRPSAAQYTVAAGRLCQSPIERRMLSILLRCRFGFYGSRNIAFPSLQDVYFPGDAAAIVPQAKIQRTPHRVDFIVILNSRNFGRHPLGFVVECDGHQWHEKTKEQAARDRKRDRDLQAEHLPVLRYTGSEIFNDPQSILWELDGFGYGMLLRLWGPLCG